MNRRTQNRRMMWRVSARARKRMRYLTLSLLLSLLLALIAACAPAPAVAPAAQPAIADSGAPAQAAGTKALTYVLAQEPRTMDPAAATESQSGLVIRNVYDRLVELAPDGQTIEPGLAESWEISEDGMVYTFHLRPGVTFHSGAPLTAEAVRFSLERVITLAKGQSFPLVENIDPANIVVVDDQTVEITLNRPYEAILSILALHNVGSILNPEMVTANATADDPWAETFLTTTMDGTGPFKFVEWQPKQFVAVERNDDYWKGPAQLDQIIFRLIEEDATKRLMLETGEAHIIHNLPTDMVDALRANADVAIAQKPGLETTYWAFNNQAEPFDDPLVRQAVSYAIDYDAIMNGIVRDGGVQMRGPMPQGLPGYDESVPVYTRDLDRARELLAEAGYPDGFSTVTHYPVWRDLADIVVVMQANLAEVGIDLELQEVPLNTLVDVMVSGETPFFPWVSTPTYADPDAVMYPKFHTDSIALGAAGNIARYSNPEVDALLDEAKAAVDRETRLEIYRQIQHTVVEDAAWIFLFQSVTIQPHRASVTGFEIPVIGVPDFWPVDISE